MTRRNPIVYKRGNTWPPIDDIITDRNGPVDTSAAITLRFLIRKGTPDGELVATGTATAGNPDTAAVDGGIRYLPTATDTDDIGNFIGEWELTFSGPKVASAPNGPGEYIPIIITENLA
jgi:hypothetical protein